MTSIGRVKGGAIQSRLEFVRERGGEAAVQRVLARLSEEDRKAVAQVLTGSWFPFELNARLDEAVAAEFNIGERIFHLMGEKSADHNLQGAHKVFVTERDPHGLLKRSAQIYQTYYDNGRRDYERVSDHKAVLRTSESTAFSRHDCMTVVGWHKKAIEMCAGKNVRVRETKCRANGADVCEYVCEWE